MHSTKIDEKPCSGHATEGALTIYYYEFGERGGG